MNKVEFTFPESVVVRGALFTTTDPTYLVQDLLEIDLPNGITIDAGWYPESDPNGSFQLVVFKGYWENQLREPFETQSITELASEVNRLVHEYQNPTVTIPCSASSVDSSHQPQTDFELTLAAA